VQIFDFINPTQPQQLPGTAYHYRILPNNSTILQNVLKNSSTKVDPANLIIGLEKISIDSKYIFIDASYDIVKFSDLEIQLTVELVRQYFKHSKVVFLSGNSIHYYTQPKNIVWYPNFLLWDYPEVQRPKQKRIGCLNRRNAPHRIWLMHNLLSEGIIDHDRDIFSVSFVHFLDPNYYADVDGWLKRPNHNYNQIIKQYPYAIATVPDNFSNNTAIDMTINHPAWHTAITIITETECIEPSMISEKIVKAIVAESCWIAYTGVDSIRLLNDLGFDTKLFEFHASGTDIECIRQVCKTIDTESLAMEYYQSKQPQIKYNKQHLINGNWLERYQPKLNSVLTSL